MTKFFKWLGILIGALFLIVIVLGVLLFMGVLNNQSEKSKGVYITEDLYSDDRKTVESFGNKRFAIEKGTKVDDQDKIINGEKRYFLFDRCKNEDVDYDVKSYQKLGFYVYVIGSKGYTKLNYETAEVKQSKDLSGLSEEDKEIFNKMDDKNHD